MNNTETLEHIRHSTAHLLAAAVLRMHPTTKLTIGPAIETGFYYDMELPAGVTFSDADFPKIEKMMTDTLKGWEGFIKREVTEEDARAFYKDNPYKLELIDEIVAKNEPITFYKAGYFEDLCRGGHSEHPKEDIGSFKLLSVAGAYWKGSEKNKMLTRIYGTSFASKEELDLHLSLLEEAKKRDHKKLGRELDLFMFDETSPGMTYWLPKGLTIYNSLYGYAREMYKKYEYQEVATPQLNKSDLYVTSGHWEHYKDDMFVSDMGEGEVFGIKPMNCPNAMRIFDLRTRSYNELPLRLADTSLLHRFELSGTLNGLFRARQFRQDDGHIFLMLSQVKAEFNSLMKMIGEMYAPFDLTYKLRFGTRPENFMGEEKDWNEAESILKGALEESGFEFFEAAGEGAFYGPKIDILMKDSLNREWQTGTIQLDFQQPKRFDLSYIDNQGKQQTPVVIHRAIYGSLERFLGVLIEHYAGIMPSWLAPVQIMLLPIADRHTSHAEKIAEMLQDLGIRAEINSHSDTLQAKIREATLQKVPFMGIIGDKEVADDAISIRLLNGEDLGTLGSDQILQKVKETIDKKK